MSHQIYIDTVTGTYGSLNEIVTKSVDYDDLDIIANDMSDSEICEYGKNYGKPVTEAVKHQYFHTDDQAFLIWFASVVTRAAHEDLRLRLKTLSDGSLQVKLGEGGWSHPFKSTYDPYREV